MNVAMNVAIIAVLGSPRQNECFWPTYRKFKAGIDHDLIIVNRNMLGVPQTASNSTGSLIFEDKSNIWNGQELPHKAFGAYRYYGQKYSSTYDYIAFISDDVLFQTDNWLIKAVELLERHEKLGFVGTQIFNGSNGEYPHESHCRAPIWFAKTSALKKIRWEFGSDHDGEMRLASSFIEAGYFGAQLGNKIDIAYDSAEAGQFGKGDHIAAIMAKYFGVYETYTLDQMQAVNEILKNKLLLGDDSAIVKSPYAHIGQRKVISQIQPFHGLIIDTGLELAGKTAEKFNFNIHLLKDTF